MVDVKNILISLDSRHALNIFEGNKTVEFRRRKMSVSIGTTVWIYVKLPIGSIVGKAKIQTTHYLTPTTLWRKFGPYSGLSRQELFKYYEGREQGFALVLTDPEYLVNPISLDRAREIQGGFQPPQFFINLLGENKLLNQLLNS